MKKLTATVLALVLCFGLVACGSSNEQSMTESPRADTAAPTENPLLHVEEKLQGTWEFLEESTGFGEILVFKNGSVEYTGYLTAARDKDTHVYGTYQITDKNVITTLNDHNTYFDFEIDSDRMALTLYIDSGYDKGSTRVYYQTEKGILDPEQATVNRPAQIEEVPATVPSSSYTPDISVQASSGERNALASAKSYLQVMAFSYKGLIEQLEYEGYTHSEATYGADNCGADWYEQAAKCAASYLDVMPFSRKELIEQLEYEGFTYDQAVYGVDKVY